LCYNYYFGAGEIAELEDNALEKKKSEPNDGGKEEGANP